MHLLLSTVALRPYVFIFLAAFLFIAIINFGLRATLLFTVLTYVVSLACEWSSVHDGFPFGLYHYIQATRGREIWVFGVPLMDSLSFTFLAFASYTVALLLTAPLYRRGWDLRLLDTWQLRRSPRVWLMAALFMVMVDMVVDPLSVLGDRWFLGKIFWYDPPGPHFGVPISNYLGWFFVAAIGIAIFQLLDAWLNRGARKPFSAAPGFPCRALLGAGRERVSGSEDRALGKPEAGRCERGGVGVEPVAWNVEDVLRSGRAISASHCQLVGKHDFTDAEFVRESAGDSHRHHQSGVCDDVQRAPGTFLRTPYPDSRRHQRQVRFGDATVIAANPGFLDRRFDREPRA